MDRGNFAVRIGDMHMYGSRHNTKDDTYNISVKNVYGRGRAVLALAREIENLTLYGIESAKDTRMFHEWDGKHR